MIFMTQWWRHWYQSDFNIGERSVHQHTTTVGSDSVSVYDYVADSGGDNLKGEGSFYCLTSFYWRLHENEEKLAEGGSPLRHLDSTIQPCGHEIDPSNGIWCIERIFGASSSFLGTYGTTTLKFRLTTLYFRLSVTNLLAIQSCFSYFVLDSLD